MNASRTGLLVAAAASLAAGLAIAPAPSVQKRQETKPPRLVRYKTRTPNGLTIRSLKRAINSGYQHGVVVKPERRKLYMSSHARAMVALREVLEMRG